LVSTLRHERLDFTGEEKSFAPATRKELLESSTIVAEARELLSKATDEELAKVWTLTYKGQQIFSMPRQPGAKYGHKPPDSPSRPVGRLSALE